MKRATGNRERVTGNSQQTTDHRQRARAADVLDEIRGKDRKGSVPGNVPIPFGGISALIQPGTVFRFAPPPERAGKVRGPGLPASLTFRGFKAGDGLVLEEPDGAPWPDEETNFNVEHWNEKYAPLVVEMIPPEGQTAATGNRQQATGPTDCPSPPVARCPLPVASSLVAVPVEAIEAPAHAVRSAVDDGLLASLGASIEAVGLIEPVILRRLAKGRYEMIAGMRRLAAVKASGAETIEAKVYDHLDDRAAARIQLAENLQREALGHMDVAMELGRARDAGMTVAQIAADCSASPDYVQKHLDLLRLAEPVRRLVASGRLPVKQAELIARVGDPAHQINLAAYCCNNRWDARKARWEEYAFTSEGPPDHVQPMGELRTAVGSACLSLAMCGWLKEEQRSIDGEGITGKRRCHGCCDNTATYADQPTLFAGVQPRGSAKKGHCTNETCYRAKEKAWEKIRTGQKAQAEKLLAKKIAAAQAAGLDVCSSCRRIAGADEQFVPDTADEGPGKICPKCAEKVRKDAQGGGRGGRADYRQHHDELEKLRKAFPATPEQKHAVALYEHGLKVCELIGRQLVTGGCDGAEAVILGLYCLGNGHFWLEAKRKKELPTLQQLLKTRKIGGKALGAMWKALEPLADWRPGIDYNGRPANVPLRAEAMEMIDALGGLAAAWGAKVPERPTAPAVGNLEPRTAKREPSVATEKVNSNDE